MTDWPDPNTAYDPNPTPSVPVGSWPPPDDAAGYQGPPSYGPGPTVASQPYPAQPYPAQPYPAQPYPAQPYPMPTYAPWPTPFPPQSGRPGRTLRPWLISGVVATAVVVATVIAIVVGSSSSPPLKSITPPAQASGYTQIRQIGGNELSQLLQVSGIGANSALYENAQVALYGQGSDDNPALIFLSISARDSAQLRDELDQDGYSATVDELLSGAGADQPQAEDPGPLGGSLKCSTIDQVLDQVVACGWADRNGLGLVLLLTNTDPASAAQITVGFRAAAEH